jgi:hypothetical protein
MMLRACVEWQMEMVGVTVGAMFSMQHALQVHLHARVHCNVQQTMTMTATVAIGLWGWMLNGGSMTVTITRKINPADKRPINFC